MPDFNSPEIARLWRDRQGRFATHLGDGALLLREKVELLARLALQKLVYSQPEDVNPNTGKKRWVRSGELLAAEQAKLGNQGEVTLTNKMAYAHRRHEANRPGFPFKVNPARTAHWRDGIRDTARAMQLELYAEGVRRILRG